MQCDEEHVLVDSHEQYTNPFHPRLKRDIWYVDYLGNIGAVLKLGVNPDTTLLRDSL